MFLPIQEETKMTTQNLFILNIYSLGLVFGLQTWFFVSVLHVLNLKQTC